MGQDGLRGLQKSCRKAAGKDSSDFTPPGPSPRRASLVQLLSNAKDFLFSSSPLQQSRGNPCPGEWQAQGWPCLGSAHPTRTKALPALSSNHKTTFPSPKTGGSAQHGAQLDGWLSKGPRTAGYPLPPSLQRAGLHAGGAEPRPGEGGSCQQDPQPPGTPLPSPVPHTGCARSRRGFRMPRRAGGAPALFGLSCERQLEHGAETKALLCPSNPRRWAPSEATNNSEMPAGKWEGSHQSEGEMGDGETPVASRPHRRRHPRWDRCWFGG